MRCRSSWLFFLSLAFFFLPLTARAAVLTSFRVSPPASVTPGVPFSLYVYAIDESGNVMTSFTGTVHLSTGNAGDVLPPDYTYVPADQGQHPFNVTLNNPGTRTITASSGSVTGSATVSVTCPNFTVTASNSGPICPNATPATLTASTTATNVTFQWAGPGFSGPTDGAVAYATQVGTYKVTMTQPSTGCTTYATTTVELRYTPWLTFPGFGCASVPFNLTVTSSDSPVLSNISWTADHATILNGQGTPTVTLLADADARLNPGSINVTVTATDSLGCYRSGSHPVTLLGVGAIPVQSAAPQDLEYAGLWCAGGDATAGVLSPAQYDSYQWNVTGGTITQTGVGGIAIHIDPSAMSVRIDLSARLLPYDCPIQASYNHAVTGPFTPISTDTSLACASTTHLGWVAPYSLSTTYDWGISNGTILSGNGTPSITWRAGTSGATTLTVSTAADCLPARTVSIPIGRPTADVTSHDQTIAPGGTAQLQVSLTGTAPFAITWSDGVTQSGIATTTLTRTVQPSQTTSYSITSFSDANCSGIFAGSMTVTVAAPPPPVKHRAAKHI